jgi:hypothetical protein
MSYSTYLMFLDHFADTAPLQLVLGNSVSVHVLFSTNIDVSAQERKETAAALQF